MAGGRSAPPCPRHTSARFRLPRATSSVGSPQLSLTCLTVSPLPPRALIWGSVDRVSETTNFVVNFARNDLPYLAAAALIDRKAIAWFDLDGTTVRLCVA